MSAKLLRIGRDIQSRVKDFFENAPGADATPLELLQATLDALERKVQPAGRGRRVFPYDRIDVHIAQPGADPVAIDAIFDQLEERLRERLGELQCEAPERIRTNVVFANETAESMLTVECSSDMTETVETAEASSLQRKFLRITVVKGQCSESDYVFDEPVVRIGRTAEPTDAYGQIRLNHVVFLDERDGVNETVGRAHARLEFDRASGNYHLFNDGSSNPTSIVRGGQTIRVAPRDPRGVRVQSGDQIQLGRAALRITVD